MTVAPTATAEIFRLPFTDAQLGKRMRRIREARGFSQSVTARMTGVAKQTVSNWERGESPPGVENLRRFCGAMRVSMLEIWGNSSPDLTPIDPALARLHDPSRLLPVLPTVAALGIALMNKQVASSDRVIATINPHPPGSMAFLVDNEANAPRFSPGDIVTVTQQHDAERGSMVVAYVKELDRFVFRKYMPQVDGKVEGAILRALNDSSYPDIEMSKGDVIWARMGEHTSTKH